MSIWERVEAALSDLGVPYAANAFIPATGNLLPDEFLVYWLVSSPPLLHAENLEDLRYYRMQVTVYSRTGLASLPDVDGAMVAAGFSKSAKRELPYSTTTRHYSLACEYIYLEDPNVDEDLSS